MMIFYVDDLCEIVKVLIKNKKTYNFGADDYNSSSVMYNPRNNSSDKYH